MKVGILGYGKEGKSAEQYFQKHQHETAIFDNFTTETLKDLPLADLDFIMRSPSVPPQDSWSSVTKYFFSMCPCPIIGVTGTKGKGTTCSLITAIFEALGHKAWLVGNIGTPALDVLDDIRPNDIAIYELSSFQLWDLRVSPQIAVILGIEPDHLNIHKDFNDYVNAKAHIAEFQQSSSICIYYDKNPYTRKIAERGLAQKIPYPVSDLDERIAIDDILTNLKIPGQHNRDNAEAALLAVASYFNLPIDTFISIHETLLARTLANFQGLPHRLQFLRELNHIKYYDDNFCTNATSLQVALQAFPNRKIVLIAGGRDKTDNQDLPEIAGLINDHDVVKTILIGESGQALKSLIPGSETANTLDKAVKLATTNAKQLGANIVLMSPAAASFDMFENVYDRGAQFQKLVQELQ